MAFADNFIAQRQFEMDSAQPDYNESVQKSKMNFEDEARRELDAKMSNSLADYITQPSWSVGEGALPHIHLYTLTMKIIFKP